MKTIAIALGITVTLSLVGYNSADGFGGKRYKDWQAKRAEKKQRREYENSLKPKPLTELEQFDKDHPPKQPFSEAVERFRADMVKEVEKTTQARLQFGGGGDMMDLPPEEGDRHAKTKYRVVSFLKDPDSSLYTLMDNETFNEIARNYYNPEFGSGASVFDEIENARAIARIIDSEVDASKEQARRRNAQQ